MDQVLSLSCPHPLTLYPAIDLKGGQCVRLKQGEMDQATIYSDDPGAQAQAWNDQGCQWLHVVDLDGAFAKRPVNVEAVHQILQIKKHLLSVVAGFVICNQSNSG